MIRRLILGSVALALACAGALAQQFKHEKYTLDNGMTVILYEDHSVPVVAVNTWYRVGAKDEAPGRSGFAHLFEHLMFMGTRRVPGGDFDNLMEAGGGFNNASTSLDRTNYFSSGPSSLLPTLLWLDAERLEDLGRTTNQEKLDKQRDIVRNELRQNVENTPYGKAGEDIYRLMYPRGHPYHNAVYGTHEDLEAATVDNVRDFFATFYVPNNASLVVAGDFDPVKIKPLIRDLFGTLPRGTPVDRTTAPPARLEGPVHKTLIDKVQLPMVRMAWHSPAWFADGDAEMDLVGALLTQGKNSRLYKRLVMDEKVAVDVSATQDSAGLGSLFILDVLTRPDADLTAVTAMIDEEVARLVSKGPEAGELAERQATIEMGLLSSLQSVLSVADRLNMYEYHWGHPDSLQRDLDRYHKATPHGVREWAGKVLTPNRLVMRVLPEEPQRAQNPRDTRPRDLAGAAFEPRKPETFQLSNGIQVMLWSKPELPLVATRLVITPGGPTFDPQHAGLPALAAAMLDEGAGDLDALAFASALQKQGATFSASADHESAGASLMVLKRNYDKGLALMADAVRRPRMDQEDWDRVKRLHLDELRQQDEEPTIVAARVGMRTLFGDANPYAWPTDGTPELVEKYTLRDVKAAHESLFRPNGATLLVAGAVTAEEAKKSLEGAFGDWSGPARPAAKGGTLEATKSRELRVFLVDRPGAVQTVIRFMAPAPAYRTDQRVPLQLLNTLLGGSFTSRLNQNLREQKGYTYGAGSRFQLEPSTGVFVARSSVKSEVTGASLKEFLAEFKRLRDGDVSPEEASKARETLRTETIQSFEGLSGLLAAAAERIVGGVPFDSIASDMKAMATVDAGALNGLAGGALPIEAGVLVLIGDKASILPQLESVHIPPPRQLDVRGNPVGPELRP